MIIVNMILINILYDWLLNFNGRMANETKKPNKKPEIDENVSIHGRKSAKTRIAVNMIGIRQT